jgi:hypothetical protein
MPLRLFSRAAPLVLGVLAAAIWLRRREPERPALPAGDRPDSMPFEPASRARAGRFVRAPEASAVDIVTVVDDLLGPQDPSGI